MSDTGALQILEGPALQALHSIRRASDMRPRQGSTLGIQRFWYQDKPSSVTQIFVGEHVHTSVQVAVWHA